MNPNPSRQDDERILRMLRLTDQGLSSEQIAQRFGTNSGYIRAAIRRVERDFAKSEAA